MLGAGSVIAGKYRLESSLGQGGMGAVWRATHLALGRAVAVKFVLGDAPSDETMQRFLREARSLAAVRHRNVVDVVDFGEHEGLPYLVMECLEGESLAHRLERPPAASLADVALWIGGALGGLAAIHDAGLVHRDLKPANIFLAQDADGVLPKVLDLGIARPSEAGGATITHSMQTLGTPHYMSPEQVRSAKSVDARSDVYAMGVLLYQALTGRLPFDGPSATAVIAAIVTDEPEPIAKLRPDLPRSMGELVHRAMSRDPARRHQDARAMRQALALAAQGHDATLAGELAGEHATAATIPMPALGSGPASLAAPPRSRTGRRGFLGIFGVLSMLMVAGLVGVSTTMMTARSGSDAMAPPTGATPTGGSAPVPAAPSTVSPPPSIAVPTLPAPEASAPPRFVSSQRSLSSLALAIRELPPDLRGCVRVVPHEEAWAAYALERCAARVPALLASISRGEAVLESAPTPSQLDAALEPALMRTTTRSNVRESASTSGLLLRSLPDATLVVALYGAIGAARSESGGRGTWTRAVAAEGTEGWIASGLLHPWDHCVPSGETIGSSSVIIAWTDVHEGERDSQGLLLFDPDGAAPGGGSQVRIATIDASCGIAETIELPRARGVVVDEIIVTRTAREGGSTLVLVGSREAGARRADGRTRWAAYPLRADAEAWALDLRTGQNLPETRRDAIAAPVFEGPDGEAGFWPLRVRVSGGERSWYRWDGETLAVDRVAVRGGGADVEPDDARE